MVAISSSILNKLLAQQAAAQAAAAQAAAAQAAAQQAQLEALLQNQDIARAMILNQAFVSTPPPSKNLPSQKVLKEIESLQSYLMGE